MALDGLTVYAWLGERPFPQIWGGPLQVYWSKADTTLEKYREEQLEFLKDEVKNIPGGTKLLLVCDFKWFLIFLWHFYGFTCFRWLHLFQFPWFLSKMGDDPESPEVGSADPHSALHGFLWWTWRLGQLEAGLPQADLGCLGRFRAAAALHLRPLPCQRGERCHLPGPTPQHPSVQCCRNHHPMGRKG